MSKNLSKNIFYLILITLFVNSLSEICKYSFHCNDDKNTEICAKKQKTDNQNIYDLILNPCSTSSCNIHDIMLGDSEKIKYCPINYENSQKLPSYPGGTCTKNSDCLTGICQNNKCEDFSECISHENCPLNTFCKNKNCYQLLKDGEKCNESYECKFNSFCDQKEKICKKLYSIEDGKEINDLVKDYEKKEFLCESGGYITIIKNNEKKYICETIFNENYHCKEECKYKRNSNNETININENCLCGFNKYRSKHCKLGNGENDYKLFLAMRKNYLSDENINLKYCHTLERFSYDLCNELININNTVDFRKFNQEYTNKKILALQFHRLQESENCIKNVVFGYNKNDIIPLNQSCPKFFCENINNCFEGKNPLTDNSKNIEIKLNEKICSSNEFCSINGNSNIIDVMEIMQKKNIIGKCTIYQLFTGIRYPGEDCNINNDCFLYQKCINGKCYGKNENENCTNTNECIVGYFCNKTLEVCKKQKEEGEKCEEAWDCKNYLGCYKGRCIKFGILKPGIINNEKYSKFSGENKRYYLCYTGELDGDDGTTGDYCVQTNYSDIMFKNNNKKIDENGFVKCDYNETCIYDNGKRTIMKSCGCGYNKEGQGYCPLPSVYRMSDWNNRMKYIGETANNNCHSLSRFNCYLQNSSSYFYNKRMFDKYTVNAHLFYKAEICAENIFAKGNFRKVNFWGVVGILGVLCF